MVGAVAPSDGDNVNYVPEGLGSCKRANPFFHELGDFTIRRVLQLRSASVLAEPVQLMEEQARESAPQIRVLGDRRLSQCPTSSISAVYLAQRSGLTYKRAKSAMNPMRLSFALLT